MTPIPKFIVHLMSGGLDSTVMLYDLHGQGVKIHCVLFDYKQRHVQELEWARTHCHRLGLIYTTLEIPQLHGSELTDGNGGVVVPNRNDIFLSLAVHFAIVAEAEGDVVHKMVKPSFLVIDEVGKKSDGKWPREW